jgi:hypothetical protein
MQSNALHLIPIAGVGVCSGETPKAERVLPAGYAPPRAGTVTRGASGLERRLANTMTVA